MEKRRKCGEQMHMTQIKWHVRRCTAEGFVIPEGKDECRICMQLIPQGKRSIHEKVCRGSAIANRTCGKCGEIFLADPSNGISRPMRCHEKRCKGPKPPGAVVRKTKGRDGEGHLGPSKRRPPGQGMSLKELNARKRANRKRRLEEAAQAEEEQQKKKLKPRMRLRAKTKFKPRKRL